MPGEARIIVHNKYVLIHVQGDPLSPQDIETTLTKAVEQAIESELNIIIHREMPPVKQLTSTVDFYYYGELLDKSSFRNKLALVFPEKMHHDKLRFFQTTAKNRGINIGLFSAIDEALNWIGADND